MYDIRKRKFLNSISTKYRLVVIRMVLNRRQDVFLVNEPKTLLFWNLLFSLLCRNHQLHLTPIRIGIDSWGMYILPMKKNLVLLKKKKLMSLMLRSLLHFSRMHFQLLLGNQMVILSQHVTWVIFNSNHDIKRIPKVVRRFLLLR